MTLAHSVRGFSPWSLGSPASRPVCVKEEHHSWEETGGEAKSTASWWTEADAGQLLPSTFVSPLPAPKTTGKCHPHLEWFLSS